LTTYSNEKEQSQKEAAQVFSNSVLMGTYGKIVIKNQQHAVIEASRLN